MADRKPQSTSYKRRPKPPGGSADERGSTANTWLESGSTASLCTVYFILDPVFLERAMSIKIYVLSFFCLPLLGETFNEKFPFSIELLTKKNNFFNMLHHSGNWIVKNTFVHVVPEDELDGKALRRTQSASDLQTINSW